MRRAISWMGSRWRRSSWRASGGAIWSPMLDVELRSSLATAPDALAARHQQPPGALGGTKEPPPFRVDQRMPPNRGFCRQKPRPLDRRAEARLPARGDFAYDRRSMRVLFAAHPTVGHTNA